MKKTPLKQSRCFALTSNDLLGGALFITRLDDETPVYFIKQQKLDALADAIEIGFESQIYFFIGAWKSLIVDNKIIRIGYKGAEFRGLAGRIYFVSEAWYGEYLAQKYAETDNRIYSAGNVERAAKQFGYSIADFKNLKNYEQRGFLLQTLEM